MGSITKKPKAPAITYVNPVASNISTSTVSPSVIIEPVKTDSEIATSARKESLLRRSRGRFGTIATSFRGLFDGSINDTENKRKTLLGE